MDRSVHLGDNPENLLEMGPDLPIEVFTSTEPWHQERIHALALYCSDGRWGRAFDDFCQRHLRIPRYDRWAVPGGPSWLASGDERDDFAQAAREQLDFLVQAHQLGRVILITHWGCALYGERLQQSPEACLSVQIKDVQTAAQALREWYRGIRVEGYLAMRRDRNLSFHELGVWG
jgi:Putative carbonic anhydrase